MEEEWDEEKVVKAALDSNLDPETSNLFQILYLTKEWLTGDVLRRLFFALESTKSKLR
jgi:hypothetical protein